jgi:hypothetical protein
VLVVKTQKRRANRATSPHRNALPRVERSTDNIKAIKKHLVDVAEIWFKVPGHIRHRANLLEAAESSESIANALRKDITWEGLIYRATSGDPDADAVLCGKAAALIDNGEKIPDPLAEYISAKLFDQFEVRRGRANAGRSMFILSQVSALQKIGIRPTRNEASRGKAGSYSGCSLVAEALEETAEALDERGVEEVWSNRKRSKARGLTLD